MKNASSLHQELLSRKLPIQVMGEIAMRVKVLRKAEGISQAKLAAKAGVSLGSLKRFEQTGQISFESLLKIAFTLKVLEQFDLLFPNELRPSTLEGLF